MRESTPFPCRQIPALRLSAIYSFAVSYSVIGHIEVRRRVDKYLPKAGLPHMKVHGFRHSCVSYLLSNGMSYRTVTRCLGDTEQVVLQTYSHLLPDEKDEIADFLDGEDDE